MTRSAAEPTDSQQPAPVITDDIEKLRIHMVGIGGCGMSGVAALLLKRGARVSGSDLQSSVVISQLVERGAKIATQQSADTVPLNTDLVVISAAIPADHAERLEAHRRGIKVIRYAELLGTLMARYDGIAISGTHGKSTTSAWLAFTLRRAGLDPSFVVGAGVEQLGGGSGVGNGRHFVAEACEFDRSFLNLRPQMAVVLNIEEDHLDCYRNLAAIEEAFAQFVAKVPPAGKVIVNGDCPRCRGLAQHTPAPIVTFGTAADVTYRATEIRVQQDHYTFKALRDGQPLGEARIGLPGRHNVDNALAVIASAHEAGVPWAQIRGGLLEFQGAQRRLEQRGEHKGICILDDYAHHPTEIRATLQAARQRYKPRRLWCVFQPHQHSRTRFLLADFAQSFADADEVVVPDIYFVRDSARERERVNAQDLVAAICRDGGKARHVAEFSEIVSLLARDVRANDVVITMGAGNIWKVADELVQRLGGNLSRAGSAR
jgi:UDP-N-acetylmuramate--alanine ligase